MSTRRLRRTLPWRRVLGWMAVAVAMTAVASYAWSRVDAHVDGIELTGPAIDDDAAVVGDGCTLTVALYNIRQAQGPLEGDRHLPGPRSAHLETIGDVLSRSEPDLVVLNEVAFDEPFGDRNQVDVLSDRLGLPWRARQTNYAANLLAWRWAYGNAVLSRYPMRDARLVEMPARATWRAWLWGHNQGLEVIVDTPWGALRLVAVHLDHADESVRQRSTRIVAERLRDTSLPAIVAGDMNAVEQSATIETLAHLPTLQATAPDTDTWSSTDPHKKIDWIFAPADWAVARAKEPQTEASDHLPVVVTLRSPDCHGE